MKINRLFYNYLLLFALLSSCQSNSLEVDVSESEVVLSLGRMEQDLLASTTQDINNKNKALIKKYGALYEIFVSDMIVEGSVHDPAVGERLNRFIKDSTIRSIYNSIENEFQDFSPYHQEFNKAFSHYHYYFPDSLIPNLVTFYSNFNAKVFPTPNTLAIGLDMYLGSDNTYVKQIPTDVIPQFIKNDMNKKYMVADGLKYWLLNHFYDDKVGDDFASKIIELGKIMYLLDAMMPNTSDDIKINYTPKELAWVQYHEDQIWRTLVDEKVLYTKNPSTINQYIIDGPFTKGLPNESPSKVGVWIGWQIVRDYVEENNVELLSLLKEKNNIKILKSYKHGK